MPTKRVRRGRHIEVDPELVEYHLRSGDCVLAGPPPFACACGIRRADGSENEELAAHWRRILNIDEGIGDAE